LARSTAEEKANATLRNCVTSGEPIENPDDQCSVVFWSPERSELLLYRDWRGSPPLYYFRAGSTFMWSTSIRQLLAFGAPRVVDPVSLAQLQQVGYVPAPRTMVESIRKVPAGHILRFGGDDPVVMRHWTPSFTPKHHDDVEERADRIEEMMGAAITRMCPPDEVTAVLLSGGIDSNIVLAVAKQVAQVPVEAYTFHYEGYSGRLNESPKARLTAEALGVRHHEIPIGPSYVIENLPKLVEVYEEPMTYGVHSSRLDPIKEAGIKVALSGVDAPFFNTTKPMARAIKLRRWIPEAALDVGTKVTQSAASSWGRRANAMLTLAGSDSSQRYISASLHSVIPERILQGLYRDPSLHSQARTFLEHELVRELVGTDGWSPRDQLVLLGLTGSGPENMLTWNYRFGRAAGVSLRFPLYDQEFVDYMSRRPMGSAKKDDLRALGARLLPEQVARAPKVAQEMPLATWFRGPLNAYLRERLNKDEIERDGLFEPEAIRTCLEEHLDGRANHNWLLWTSLTYLTWRNTVLGA
jgi:asparagine synthase (glutamine-hydrolysing)